MFGVIQFIRNSLIRLEGLLYQLFGFIGKIFSTIFSFLANLFGFSKPAYFLEYDEATTTKRSQIQKPTETEPQKTTEVSFNPRRRPDPKMDYFRKMAQEIRKS